MIDNYEYRIPLAGRRFDEIQKIIDDHAGRLIRIRPWLLSCSVIEDGTWISVKLRMADVHSSRIAVNGRKAIIAMAIKAKLDPRSVQLRQVLTEPNGRSFKIGQGRTARPRPKRQESSAQ